MSEVEFLEKYRKAITKEILKTLIKETIIYDKNGETQLAFDQLYDIIIKPKIVKRCLGIINSTNGIPDQCSKTALLENDYCKIHLQKWNFISNEGSARQDEHEHEIEKEQKENLVEKFINNDYYYIDENKGIIYEMSSNEICGYIQDFEYIFN